MSFFVATRRDLEPGLLAAEQQFRLKYIPCIDYPTPAVTFYTSALDIPDLGSTRSPYACASPSTSYFGFERASEVHVEYIAVDPGWGDSYYQLNEKANPNGFVFCPGGWYTHEDFNGECLIGG